MNFRTQFLRMLVFGLTWVCSHPASAENAAETTHPSKVELFTSAVHTREVCTDSQPFCSVNLQKRTDSFNVIFRGTKEFTDVDVFSAATKTIEQITIDIEATTGLDMLYSKPDFASNFLFVVFFNHKIYDLDPENYIATRITRRVFAHPEILEREFRRFIDSSTPCMYFFPAYDDSKIRQAHVWIKVEADQSSVSKCIAEEFYNSMGIDDSPYYASIFDWPGSTEPTPDGIARLSPLHLEFLRALYSGTFQPGQPEIETFNEALRLLK